MGEKNSGCVITWVFLRELKLVALLHNICFGAMQEQMINQFFLYFAYKTFIWHYCFPHFKLNDHQKFFPCCLCKKFHLHWSLGIPCHVCGKGFFFLDQGVTKGVDRYKGMGRVCGRFQVQVSMGIKNLPIKKIIKK